MNIKISIIIPVYNVEKYLEECLNSVINQVYKNLEIILVNDGSTDKSGEICDKFALQDSRIKVFHQKNSGVSSARNIGLDNVNGDFVTFLDSDDTIDKEHISNMVNLLSDDIDIVCSPLKYDIYEFEKKELNSIDALKYILYEKKYNFGWNNVNKIFNIYSVKDVRYLQDEKVGEDFSFTWKVFLNSKKVVFTNKKTYNYRISDTSVMQSTFDERHKSLLLVCDRFIEHIKNNNIDLLKEAYFFLAKSLYSLSIRTFNISEIHQDFMLQLKQIAKYMYKNKNISMIFKVKIFSLLKFDRLFYLLKSFKNRIR